MDNEELECIESLEVAGVKFIDDFNKAEKDVDKAHESCQKF